MSIATENRDIALKAYSLFHSWDQVEKKENVKDYLNAVQKSMLLLGTQGFKRTLLYITSQMNKDNPKEWGALYNQLSSFLGVNSDEFQYKVIADWSKEEVALEEERITFFLLSLKRLSSAKYNELK